MVPKAWPKADSWDWEIEDKGNAINALAGFWLALRMLDGWRPALPRTGPNDAAFYTLESADWSLRVRYDDWRPKANNFYYASLLKRALEWDPRKREAEEWSREEWSRIETDLRKACVMVCESYGFTSIRPDMTPAEAAPVLDEVVKDRMDAIARRKALATKWNTHYAELAALDQLFITV